MASDPIPEPLKHQDVDEDRQADFPESSSRRRVREVPIRADRELPSTADARLRHAAEALGTTLGQAVNVARETKRKAAETGDRSAESLQGKVQSITERASGALAEVQDSAAQAYEDATRRAATSYEESRASVAEIIESVRRRVRYLAEEYPLQLIAAVAGAAFLTGVLLRIWRSARDQ
jgi:ElaB/YqjD/DUF883 family membrane-anchored ribosome-binding protein